VERGGNRVSIKYSQFIRSNDRRGTFDHYIVTINVCAGALSKKMENRYDADARNTYTVSFRVRTSADGRIKPARPPATAKRTRRVRRRFGRDHTIILRYSNGGVSWFKGASKPVRSENTSRRSRAYGNTRHRRRSSARCASYVKD